MKFRRVLLALLVAFLAIGVAPPPSAHAGGPTSVLMSSPDQQRVGAAYYSDAAYSGLTAAVGGGQTGPNAPPAGLATGGGEDVRLTWLIHDVQIWRIDRVHLTSANGMWIETVVDVSGKGRILDLPAHWHRPADEAALVAVLSEAGLLGDSGAPPTDPPAPAADPTAPAPKTVVPTLLLAALAGLVLGVAGTFVGMRARSGKPADPAPRVSLSG
jgi:hypothetical protein